MSSVDRRAREYVADCTTCGAWTMATYAAAVAWTGLHGNDCPDASTEIREVRSTPRTMRPLPTSTSNASLALDRVVRLIDLSRHDVNAVMRELPERSSLWVHVDLVRALCHLRQAVVLIDKCTDGIDGEVTRR